MKNTNPTPLRSASLIADNGFIIDVTFNNEGKLQDISVFDGTEILLSETAIKAEMLMEAIEFALNFDYPNKYTERKK